MLVATELIGLAVVVLAVTSGARHLGWPAPVCLVAVGVAASFVPGMPTFRLDPQVVLVGLLPPLLYSAALRSSVVDLRADRGPIGLLAVGLVVFSTLFVGVTAWLVVPGLPLAAAFAVGAVVAPPDAVSATAVARRVGLPRRIVRILEGESLANDAVALVALSTAITAMSETVHLGRIAADLVVAAGGGLLIGLVVGRLTVWLRRRLDDAVTDTALSLVVPFAAYLPADAVGASGVLAVVVTGLVIGHHQPQMLSGPARLASRLNWRTIAFLLGNVVFLLIGLQLRAILDGVATSGLSVGTLVGICAVVLAATVGARGLWVFGIGLARRVLRGRAWPWSNSTVIAWAGMRGVVTLAAAFVLPMATPQRPVLVLAAFVVVAGTLLLHGTTLPLLVRSLRIPGPDPGEDALQESAVLTAMTQTGLERLEQARRPEDPPEVIERLVQQAQIRTDTAWEQLGAGSPLAETPTDAYRRLRMTMLAAERDELLAIRDRAGADHDILLRILDALDLEESLLVRRAPLNRDDGRELRTPAATARSCAHLSAPQTEVAARTPAGCQECLAEGSTWVHLRVCLRCGHVGCCDSSPRRHAEAHHHATGHPVIRSFEPGESWRWCYLDRILG